MRRGRRWTVALAAILTIGTLAAASLFWGREPASSAEPVAAATLNTAVVVRADLFEETEFDGTVGLLDPDPVVVAVEGIVSQLAPVNSVLDEGDIAYQVSGVNVPVIVGNGVLYRDLQLSEAPIPITALGSGTVTQVVPVGSEVGQGDVLYYFDGQPVVALFGAASINRVLDVPDVDATSTYASDIRGAQDRHDLVEAIGDAEERLVDYRAALPSTTLLLAIEDLTELELVPFSDQSRLRNARVAVAEAQKADNDGLEAAEDAVERARVTLVEFDARQAAAARDEAVAQASRIPDNLTGNDVLELEQALVEMGYDPGNTVTVDREYTSATASMVRAWQADVGAAVTGTVEPSQVVFIEGPATVVKALENRSQAAPGTHVLSLSNGEVVDGDDVLMLENALVRSGLEETDDLDADGVFDQETQTAVLAWQRLTGQDEDGVVSPSDVLVVDEPSLVSEHHVDLGDPLTIGTAVFSLTSTERRVTVDVPAEDQSLLTIGDEVTIELPDFSETLGTVSKVSTTATTASDGSTIFEATVDLVDPSVASSLDEAPVDVTAAESKVTNAIAVPVSALLALIEGGYAVEIVADGGTRLVGVEPGFFADGLVEIRSGDVAVDDEVVVP